ncbi:MAG: IS21-like element helper ATPase IstB [Pseudomonadota bacterium]|nr:IS21-like element helper ATPase IstB [Pseudomonadota bacterium]
MSSSTAALPLMLKQLRLASIKENWQSMAAKAVKQQWSPQQYLHELCLIELNSREDKRLKRYLHESALPAGKRLNDYDFTAVKGVKPAQINTLINERQWVSRGYNVMLFGASGVGKTHLASALGYALIEHGVRVKFMPATLLVQQLQKAKAELRLNDALNKLDRYAVLIVDDIGYVRKTEQESSVLFELIAHRYERGSLIITSNQSFEDWDQLFDDTVMTVAAIDRLVHNATIIHCEGDSYRRKTALKQMQN